MPVPSLFDMAMRRCTKSHKNIQDVGDIPFEIVKPILVKVNNPTQLYELEKNSPQLIGADADIWRALVNRDIPMAVRTKYDYEPEDPKNWYNVYRILKKEADKGARDALAVFGKKMSEVKQAKEDIVVQQVRGLHRGKARRGQIAPPKRQADAGKTLITKMRTDLKNNKTTSRVLINPQRRMFNVNDKRVVTKAPAGMLQDYQADKAAGRTHTKPAIPTAARSGYKPGVRTTPSTSSAAKKLDIVEQRRLSEAQLASMAGEEGDDSASRKRPAQSATPTKPGSNIFMQPKRRKIG